MPARPSEIRAFLLRHAERKKLRLREHASEGVPGRKPSFFCHLQAADGDPLKTATAVSKEHADNALVMSFLSFYNNELDFLPENDTPSPR